MMQMSKQKQGLMVIVLTLLFVLFFLQFIEIRHEGTENEAKTSSTVSATSVADAEKKVAPVIVHSDGTTEDEAKQTREEKIRRRLEEADRNISKLQALLDGDGSSRQEAFELSGKLLKDGIAAERFAALNALRWLGGREAVQALIPLIEDEDVLDEQVDETLRDLIEESLYSDVRMMTKEDWLEVLQGVGTEAGMNVYLTLMSAFPELDSVPVLLELFRSDSALNQRKAREFLEFISSGQDFPTPQDAQKWWNKWLADRGITQGDLDAYNQAGNETWKPDDTAGAQQDESVEAAGSAGKDSQSSSDSATKTEKSGR